MSRIALVARREIVTRIRTKSYVIGLVLSALMVVAAAAVPRMIGDQTYDVGVVGPVPAAVEGVAFRPYPDEAAARAAVLAGEIDAALINDEKVLAHGELNERLGLILQSAHREAKIAAAGITITPLRVESVGEDAEHTGMRTGVAALLVIVLFFLLIYTAMYVAMGVVEEKGSRIVEILLTSLRPWELLGGKIIGLGVLGLINLG
ncbi:MAG: ABC transporter permease, partial [Thermobispora sp.]|nr:ABC transporter permease [Thermobispora sp.]